VPDLRNEQIITSDVDEGEAMVDDDEDTRMARELQAKFEREDAIAAQKELLSSEMNDIAF
jgi:hypothetical protein